MERPDSNPKSAYGITKPPLHLIPSPALCRVAMVMRLGAQKYGAYNWRAESVAATVYVSAAQRHIAAWLDGEAIDAESGQPHIAHAAACLLILLDAQDNGKMVDDRPPAAVTGQLIRDLAVKPKPNRIEDWLTDRNDPPVVEPLQVRPLPMALCARCSSPNHHVSDCSA